jgi:hypothetical protein
MQRQVKTALAMMFISVGATVNGQTAEVASRALALSDLVQGFRGKHSLKGYAAKLEDLRHSQINSTGRRFQTPPNLAMEAELSPDGQHNRKFTAKLTQSIALGVDKNAINDRFSAGTSADLITKQIEMQEHEKEIAVIYTDLRLAQELYATSKSTSDMLDPLVKKAKAASDRGTLSGLFARRWSILLTKMRSDNTEALNSYGSSAATLTKITGLVISTDPSMHSLAAIPSTGIAKEFKNELYPQLKASMFRQKAMTAEAVQRQASSEISAGIGISHDFESKERAVTFEIAVPLFSSTIAKSSTAEIIANRDALTADTDIMVQRAHDQFTTLTTAADRAAASRHIADERVESLTALYLDSQKAFDRAQTEIAETVETLNELYDARRERAEKIHTLDVSLLNLHYLAGEYP